MEETLTDCLVRVREDLNELKKVREYLETNAETEDHFSVTWRTIEAFNSILSICSSQNTPETNALDTLLDSLYFLARNNTDSSVWENFGFELGIICMKILSAIERTEIFELLFCKLLSIISMICEHNSSVWKAAARQILNVFINKKFSSSYLEAVLKWYLCIIRNIKSYDLYDFSLQNLHLLKTLSLLVQRVGDFEIQCDIIKVIFLHLSKDIKLMRDFFAPAEKKLLQSLQFTDFDVDCRLYLNALNASRKGCERKVYSISCSMLFLGGCRVEPPFGRNFIWADANRESERVSIKCGDTELGGDRVIYIQFSEILNARLENYKTKGNHCLTIQTKSLVGLYKDVKNNDICLLTENVEKIHEFVQFLEDAIRDYKKKRKFGGKMSRTIDSLLIDRNSLKKKVQDNVVTGSEKTEIDHILPDVLSLFENAKQATAQTDVIKNETRTPQKTSQAESKQLSPSSFVESLNKHMGLNSPELRHTFEDSVETIEFFQKGTPGKTHKLFRSSDKIFNILETGQPNNPIFGENKENTLPVGVTEHGGSRNETPTGDTSVIRALKDQTNIEAKFLNSQSQDYFQRSSNIKKKKKPCLPKLKRNTKTTENKKPERSMSSKKNKSKSSQNRKTGRKDASEHLEKMESMKKRTLFRNKQEKPEEDRKSEKQYRYSLRCEINTEVEKRTKRNENQVNKTSDRKLEAFQKDTKNLKQKGNKSSKPKTECKTNTKAEEKTKQNESRVEKSCNGKPEAFEKKTKSSKQQKKQNKSEVKSSENQYKSKREKEEEPEKSIPSLLDPNGYAYQRWCRPTTSERSNFWLKKLEATQKSKTQTGNVFDFCDESDSIVGRHQKKKRRVVHSKRKCRTIGQTKQTSLREVKKILKNPSPAIEKSSPTPQRISPPRTPQSPRHTETSPGFLHLQSPAKRSLTPETFREYDTADDLKYESVPSSEDEEPLPQSKKREVSEEENPTAKRYVKKKLKATLPENLLSSIRRRLHRSEEKDRHHTDEITQTVSKAANHLFNHLQRKDGEKVLSYLNAAEAVSLAFDAEIGELNIRGNRIQRAILYYKVGCSVSDSCESLNAQFSKVKNALKDLREKKNDLKTIDRISERLKSLIDSEIEKSIKSEWTIKQKKLMKCASVLGIDFKEFG